MLTQSQLSAIINKYSNSKKILDNSYQDGGVEPLWARFERAASNQILNAPAILSRYAIWANNVRDIIKESIIKINNGDDKDAIKTLIKAANALSAFSEIQSYLDTLNKEEK